MVVCREDDEYTFNVCHAFNHKHTELSTKIERDFLRKLLGGCSTPISALAEVKDEKVFFKGNICTPDGKEKIDIEKEVPIKHSNGLGIVAAVDLLQQSSAVNIIGEIKNAKN
jgi:hydroxymethylbilane synthase